MSGFEKLRVSRLEFNLVVGGKGLRLPQYKGSVFRGGFGVAFKDTVCSQRHGKCKGCLLNDACPYRYVFETTALGNVASGFGDVPRPFVLRPPLTKQEEFAPGEQLTFALHLVGKGIDYLPYFVLVFRELGQRGLGQGRRPFDLDRVESVDYISDARREVYSRATGCISSELFVTTGEQLLTLLATKTPEHTLSFVTMTRLTSSEEICSKPLFLPLIRAVFRRISAMLAFHHGTELKLPFSDLLALAQGVELAEDNTAWVDWERYSSRQEARMQMGGLVGKATYRGDLTPFYPYLKAAELLHVGKGSVFGLGWLEV